MPINDSSITRYAMIFDVEDFPEVMTTFAEIGGIMQTLLYANKFGGVEFYMQNWTRGVPPKRETLNLLSIYTTRQVEALCRIFKGQRVHVKLCTDMMKKIKRMEIKELGETGASKTDIARMAGCSVRHVRQVCNG